MLIKAVWKEGVARLNTDSRNKYEHFKVLCGGFVLAHCLLNYNLPEYAGVSTFAITLNQSILVHEY